MASIIIPCWIMNDELMNYTKDCVNSLRYWSKKHELIIVNNGSHVAYGLTLKGMADIYIRNDVNLGYGPAINQGFKAATDDIVIACNNDIVFIHDWIGMVENRWDKTIGMISSHLHDHDPDHLAPLDEYPLGHMFGALWATSKDVIANVGYIDEEYEMGMYEDKDYFLRIHLAHYKTLKGGWCKHIGNATFGKLEDNPFWRNKERFENKWQLHLEQ